MAAQHVSFDTTSKGSSSSSLTYTQSKLVMDDGYQIDPDILMPSYADSNNRRCMTGKSLTYLSSDLEQYVASGANLLYPVDTYRVRTVSGDINNLKAENSVVRSRRVQQYLENEANKDAEFCGQAASKQRSMSHGHRTESDSSDLHRNHSKPKFVSILTKGFGK
eukprot:CAMPEP_0184700112 /NCGR_PEP_ID=MMETSP0313-20130426/8721_1 /TAXON_ID=2792 /ORGANISM="Porphyridium aerugineum, Strain SAG 1380-2" /LENGTH=163 /DNA_ID=CAMNT_0027159525 /DNA_START=76 /DNA_END=567 /DNA_ORIENTATION=+